MAFALEASRISIPFAEMRRLIARARSIRPPAPVAGDELYTLHIAGQPAENIQGPMPDRLGTLVHFLSGLMFTYCC